MATSSIHQPTRTPTCASYCDSRLTMQYNPLGSPSYPLADGYVVLLQCRYTDVCTGTDSFACEWQMNKNGAAGAGVRLVPRFLSSCARPRSTRTASTPTRSSRTLGAKLADPGPRELRSARRAASASVLASSRLEDSARVGPGFRRSVWLLQPFCPLAHRSIRRFGRPSA